MGVGGKRHTPAFILPGKETWYTLSRMQGGPHGSFARVRKISPQPGFDPRTAQHVE